MFFWLTKVLKCSVVTPGVSRVGCDVSGTRRCLCKKKRASEREVASEFLSRAGSRRPRVRVGYTCLQHHSPGATDGGVLCLARDCLRRGRPRVRRYQGTTAANTYGFPF